MARRGQMLDFLVYNLKYIHAPFRADIIPKYMFLGIFILKAQAVVDFWTWMPAGQPRADAGRKRIPMQTDLVLKGLDEAWSSIWNLPIGLNPNSHEDACLGTSRGVE